MNTFRRVRSLSGPNEWGVQLDEGAERLDSGTVITVTTAAGATREVTLGEYLGVQYRKHYYRIAAQAATLARSPMVAVGRASVLIALFDSARAHLRHPAIVLSVPAIQETIRINMAGDRANVPGSLNVLSTTREEDTRFGRKPKWYGRVHRDGRFEMRNDTPVAIADRLREFAADPARVAADHGHLTGSCCFCHRALDDERSTSVGYGRVCARHYSLPWGERPAVFPAVALSGSVEYIAEAVRVPAEVLTPAPTPAPAIDPNAKPWEDLNAASRREGSEV